MPKPRVPTNILALRGTFKHDISRLTARAGEPEPVGEIGEAPDHLSHHEAACWAEIISLAHPGTLHACDRLVVEYGACLLSKLRSESWSVSPALLARFEAFLAKLGMTPSDRSRVSSAKPAQAADPLDEFAPPVAGRG